MPAKDLGTKYTCYKCGTKFYDLKKPEPVCPKCGADQRESPALKPAPARRSKEKEVAVPVEPEVEEIAGDEEEPAEEEVGAEDEVEEEEPEDDDF